MQSDAYTDSYNCNNQIYSYDVTDSAIWDSDNTSIMTVNGTGLVDGVSGGSTNLVASIGGYTYACTNMCSASPINVGSSTPTTVQVPTSLELVKTTSQGAASCSSGSAGWSRYVLWQVLDQNGKPINVQMSVSDSIKIGSQNTCGGSPISGSATTSGSGQFSDHYYLCSTACVGGTCQTDASDTYTVAGIPLTSDVKSIGYECTSITIDGQ